MLGFAAVVACVLPFLDGASAQAAAQIGGRPPKAVQTELCTIADVFSKLQGITTNEACRSGCSGGVCPSAWMPNSLDQCNPQCGRVFEPFCKLSTLNSLPAMGSNTNGSNRIDQHTRLTCHDAV